MKKEPYIIAFFFFIVDLISKQLIINLMKIGEQLKIINNFFYITSTRNNGAAWSILEDKRMLLLIITVFVLFILNKYLNKEHLTKLENFTYGMIIGGIVGNLFDRIVYKSVVDFLDFKLFGYDYPVFNLADTFIVVGIIILIIMSIRKEYYARSNSKRK